MAPADSHHIAVLLCAGYGTRMGELTQQTPKPLLPVAGRPVLDYLLDQLLELPGLRAVHVVGNAHYAAAFEAWAAERQERVRGRDRELRFHNDGTVDNAGRLGAIGDLGFVLDRLAAGGETVEGALVCAGDNILRFSLAPLWDAFRRRRETAVLAMEETDPERLRRTGVLVLGPNDRVTELQEKPEHPPSRWACPSFYALDRTALARVRPYLDAGRPADEIGRFIGRLAELQSEHRVWALRTRGTRLHVGNPQELARADELLRREPLFPEDQLPED